MPNFHHVSMSATEMATVYIFISIDIYIYAFIVILVSYR